MGIIRFVSNPPYNIYMYFSEQWLRRMGRRADVERERRIEGGKETGSRRFATAISTLDKAFIAASQAANKALERLKEEPSLAVVVFTENYDKKVVLEGISKVLSKVPIIGAIVPDTIYNEESIVPRGIGVALWATNSADVIPFLIKGITRSEEAIVEDIRRFFDRSKIKRKYSYLLGIAPNISDDIPTKLARVFGKVAEFFDGVYVGVVGEFKPSPWSVIYNGDTYSDHVSAFIIESDVKFGTLFSQGFHPFIPFKVTSVEDSVIKELNNIPVVEVFRSILQRMGYSDEDLADPIKAGKILSRFYVEVADPSRHGRFKTSIIKSLDDRGLKVSTEISVNDTLWFAKSDLEDMLEGTRKGVQVALSYVKDSSPAGFIIFENYTGISALGDEINKDKSNIRILSNLGFLGIPTVAEIIIHPDFYSGSQSGIMLGTLLANKGEQP